MPIRDWPKLLRKLVTRAENGAAHRSVRTARAGSRQISIFLSSTFLDVYAERSHLANVVMPQLQERCDRIGVDVTLVDLRWGITEDDAAASGGTLSLCLSQIERCHPYFVGIVGGRYGWIPPPERIPADLFRSVQQNGCVPGELEAFYTLDETSQAPSYVFRTAHRLSPPQETALAHLWAAAGLRAADDSITEREISRAVFESSRQPQGVPALCYLRQTDLAATPGLPHFLRLRLAEADPWRREKLHRLRARLEQPRQGLICRKYEVDCGGLRIDTGALPLSLAASQTIVNARLSFAEWEDLPQSVRVDLEPDTTVALSAEGLDAFGQMVLSDLWGAIESTWRQSSRSPRPIVEPEERFIERRSRSFIETAAVHTLMNYLSDPQAEEPLVVTGPPGSGKSSLLAKCLSSLPAGRAGRVFHAFVGASAASRDIVLLLDPLRRTRPPERESPTAGEPAIFNDEVLRLACASEPLTVFIDALDQLDPRDESQELHWLPLAVPRGSKIVVSTAPGRCLSVLEQRLGRERFLEVPVMELTARRQLIEDELHRHGKRLDEGLLDELARGRGTPDSVLPLYLRVALNELVLFGSHRTLNERIRRLPDTLTELFQQVLERLQEDHGRRLVERGLCWLAVARAGLLESELASLYRRHGFNREAGWRRFLESLTPYLWMPEERGGTVDFSHEQFRLAVHQRYLDGGTDGGAARKRRVHRELASLFWQIAHVRDDDTPRWRTQARPLRELLHHLLKAGYERTWLRCLSDPFFAEAAALSGSLLDLIRAADAPPSNHHATEGARLVARCLRSIQPSVERRPAATAAAYTNELASHPALDTAVFSAVRAARKRLDRAGPWPSLHRPAPPSGPRARHDYRTDGGEGIAVLVRDDVLATADRAGIVSCYRASTGDRLRRYHLPDSGYLIGLAGSHDRAVYLDSQHLLRSSFAPHSLAVTVDENQPIHRTKPIMVGARVAARASDGRIVLWNPQTGETAWVSTRTMDPLRCLAAADEGRVLALIAGPGLGGAVLLRRSSDGWKEMPIALPAPALQVALSDDGELLLAACQDRSLRVVETSTGHQRHHLAYAGLGSGLRDTAYRCALSGAGRSLLLCHKGQIAMWDPVSGSAAALDQIWSPTGDEVCTFLPGIARFLIAGEGKACVLPDGADVAGMRPSGPVSGVAIMNSRVLSSSAEGNTVRLENIDDHEGAVDLAFPDPTCMTPHREGLLVGTRAGDVWSHDHGTGQRRRVFWAPHPIFAIHVDGQERITVADENGTIWRFLNHARVADPALVRGEPNRHQIALLSGCDQWWSVWRSTPVQRERAVVARLDDSGETEVLELEWQPRGASSSPDGQTLCVRGERLELYRLRGSELVRVGSQPIQVSHAVFVGEAGEYLACIARIADSHTWLELRMADAGLAVICAVPVPETLTCLTARGRHIAAGLQSGNVVIWELRGLGAAGAWKGPGA